MITTTALIFNVNIRKRVFRAVTYVISLLLFFGESFPLGPYPDLIKGRRGTGLEIVLKFVIFT